MEHMMAEMVKIKRESVDARMETTEIKRMADEAFQAQEVLQQQNEEMHQRADEAQANVQTQVTNLRHLEGVATIEQPRDFQPFTTSIMNTKISVNILISKMKSNDRNIEPNKHMTNS